MFNITFLGTGASVPSFGRGLPSSLLFYKKKGIMIDCGDGATAQLIRSNKDILRQIQIILVSHEHYDHYSGMGAFIYSNCVLNRKEPLWVYGNANIIEDLNKTMSMIRKDVPFQIIPVEIKEGQLLKGNELEILAFRTDHVGDSYGFVFQIKDELDKVMKKVVFISDTLYFDELNKISNNAEIVISECTFLDDEKELAEKYKHLVLSDLKRINLNSSIGKIVLNHISSRYKLDELKPLIDENMLIPEDLFKIEI